MDIKNGGRNTYVAYRRSGNFRVLKFSCFKFSLKNIFVVQDTYENFWRHFSTFPGLVIWNETAHTKKMWSANSLRAAFVATIQLLANYYRVQNRTEWRRKHILW